MTATATMTLAVAPRQRVVGWDVLAFVVPTLGFLKVPLIGQLLGTEAVLMLLLPFLLLSRGNKLLDPLPRTFILLAALWLLAQVVTDLIRDTTFKDFSRGWARIVFATINFMALYLLINGNRRRIVLFVIGLCASEFATYALNRNSPLIVNYFWKAGVGIPISVSLVVLAAYLNTSKIRSLAGIGVVAFASVLSIYMDFRSLGAILGLTFCYQTLQWFKGRQVGKATRVKITDLWLLGVAVATVGFCVSQGYKFAAESGMLGEAAKEKYEQQAHGEYGILLGGRSEILAASQAIKDSPVIGHGSWAKNCRYTDLLVNLKERLGYESAGEVESCLIPTHSHIIAPWVEAGFFGTFIWLWALTLAARVLAHLYLTQERLVPLLSFCAFFMVWNIFFSPFAGELRYRTAFEIIVMMTFLRGSPQSRFGA
ncbi:MAG: hypothetical protein ACT4PZ_01235 [Panacagrimonas sp.]